MRKTLFFFAFFYLNVVVAQEKKNYPVIGEQCPNFVLDNVQYNGGKTRLSLSDLKGKYFILDFWAKNCLACISSMPKIDTLQKKFKDLLHIQLIGYDQKEIHPLFKKLTQIHNLNLSCAFDTIMMRQFVPDGSVPLLVWVDKNGIVRAVTASKELSQANIEKFLVGEKIDYFDRSHITGQTKKEGVDYKKLFLSSNNGGSDTSFLYRSVFSKWQPEMGHSYLGGIQKGMAVQKEARYQVIKIELISLFGLAYFGDVRSKDSSFFQDPILELHDKSAFVDQNNENILYAYSVQIPSSKSAPQDIMRVMQGDLKNYFNFEVKIEERMLPSYYLKISNLKKLTKNQSSKQDDVKESKWENGTGGYLYSFSMKKLCNLFNVYLKPYEQITDSTNDTTLYNFHLDVLPTNITDIKRALNEIGLDIIKSTKKYKTLIIKDPIN